MSVIHHTPLDCKIAVHNGINLLDEQEPGWRDLIDLDTLDVSDCTQCVLGQVYGHYVTGENRLDIHGGDVTLYGFATAGYGTDYAQLTDAWKLALST